MTIEQPRNKSSLISQEQAQKLAEGMVRPYDYYRMTPEQRTAQMVDNMFAPYDFVMSTIDQVSKMAKSAVQSRSKR